MDLIKSFINTAMSHLPSSSNEEPILSIANFPTRQAFEVDSDIGYVVSSGLLDVMLNDDVLLKIFSKVPSYDLVRCRLVCKSWCNLIDEEAWKAKLADNGKYRHNLKLRSLPWPVIVAILESKSLDCNLIKNPSGRKKLSHWKVLQSGGDGWKVETPPDGTSVDGPQPPSEDGVISCFVTSFHVCSKKQTVDLRKEGRLLDFLQPDIHVSEWIAGRWDCHAIYNWKIMLLSESMDEIAVHESEEKCGGNHGNHWRKVEHTFSNYGPGVRWIYFSDSGVDGQFWAGHYGCKMAAAEVRLSVPEFAASASAVED